MVVVALSLARSVCRYDCIRVGVTSVPLLLILLRCGGTLILLCPLGLSHGSAIGEDRPNRLLTGGMVCGDVQELAGGARLSTTELVNKGVAVVPVRNAPMMFASTTSSRELHCLENLRMQFHRDSSRSCLQLLRSQEFSGRMYVPWKFSMKTFLSSAQR
jgi:hypothetical protein